MSEVAAAAILVLIAIAGATIVYIYSSNLLGSLQGAQPQQPYTNQVALEYYDWTKTSSTQSHILKLIIRNVGSGRAVLADFIVQGTIVSLAANSTCTPYTTTPLDPQQSCAANLIIPGSMQITRGTGYVVKVVTKDGSVQTYSCIAGRTSGSLS